MTHYSPWGLLCHGLSSFQRDQPNSVQTSRGGAPCPCPCPCPVNRPAMALKTIAVYEKDRGMECDYQRKTGNWQYNQWPLCLAVLGSTAGLCDLIPEFTSEFFQEASIRGLGESIVSWDLASAGLHPWLAISQMLIIGPEGDLGRESVWVVD